MKIVKFENDPDLTFSTTGEDRSPGLHLSDIIKTMQYEREKRFNPDTPMDMMLLEQGHTWEEVLSHALQRRWLNAHPDYAGYRPGELSLDGVAMSPDWIQPKGFHATLKPGAVDLVVEEWKATKTSKNKVLEDHQWYWLVQLKAYMHALSVDLGRPVTRGRFRVWYINGDYSYGRSVAAEDMHLLRDYVRYDVEFTKRELEDNWRAVIGQAKRKGLLEQEPQQDTTEDVNECRSQRKTPAAPVTRKPSSSPRGTSLRRAAPTPPSSRTSSKRRAA